MARSLSHTFLTRLSHLPTTTASAAVTTTRLATVRHQSTQPEIPKTKEEVERAALRKLEEAIHRMIVKRAQPDWLPLVPGGSYYVPPKTKSRGFARVVSRLVNDSTSVREVMKDDKSLGCNSNRGWPSSAHFFKGGSHSPLEGEVVAKQSNKSEEEEG